MKTFFGIGLAILGGICWAGAKSAPSLSLASPAEIANVSYSSDERRLELDVLPADQMKVSLQESGKKSPSPADGAKQEAAKARKAKRRAQAQEKAKAKRRAQAKSKAEEKAKAAKGADQEAESVVENGESGKVEQEHAAGDVGEHGDEVHQDGEHSHQHVVQPIVQESGAMALLGRSPRELAYLMNACRPATAAQLAGTWTGIQLGNSACVTEFTKCFHVPVAMGPWDSHVANHMPFVESGSFVDPSRCLFGRRHQVSTAYVILPCGTVLAKECARTGLGGRRQAVSYYAYTRCGQGVEALMPVAQPTPAEATADEGAQSGTAEESIEEESNELKMEDSDSAKPSEPQESQESNSDSGADEKAAKTRDDIQV